MSTYNLNLTLENIRTITTMFLDIFIMWLVLYYALRIVRSNSRTSQIFKGILLVIIINAIAQFLGLKTVAYFANIFINWGFLAIIIIFQPEIRSLLERLGKSNVFSRITTLSGNEKEHLVDEIVTATMLLSKDQTGALISIEQSRPLDDFIATGTKLNSDVSAELLTSLFVTSTPLHDGAVIIQGDKVACASAYFPPTNLEMPSRYGARHRAAIGISEITDAVTIVVSEETGAISITDGGKIFTVDRRQLRDYLLRVICGETTEVHAVRKTADQSKTSAEQPDRTVIIAKNTTEQTGRIKKTGRLADTTVLNKLAIKKQEGNTGKIEAVEVVAPSANRKGLFSRFAASTEPQKKQADVQPDKMDELEKEATEIKLPHKKERPAPSYPSDAAGVRLEKQTRETIHQTEAESQPVQPEAETETEEQRRERIKKEKDEQLARYYEAKRLEQMKYRSQEAEPAKQNARTENSQKRSGSMPIMDQHSYEEESRKYDTSKIDISKIVGLENDLDQTLKMVDTLNENDPKTSKNREGGDKNER